MPVDSPNPPPDDPGVPVPGESRPRKLEPRMLTLWWIVAGIRGILLSLGIVAAFFLVLPSIDAARGILGVGPVPWIVGVVAWAVLVPPLRYRRWRYALRAEDLWIRRGLLWRSVSVIPYRRLQFVDTRQGPLENLFDLSQLVVHTAAPGTSGWIPGLDREEAETIRERLAALAGETDDPV